jgi:hypothetical protein
MLLSEHRGSGKVAGRRITTTVILKPQGFYYQLALLALHQLCWRNPINGPFPFCPI